MAVPWRPGLPNKDELAKLVKETYRDLKRLSATTVVSELRNSEFEQLVLNLRGLTRSEAVRVIESVILDDGKLDSSDLQRVIDGKRRLLESSGALESIAIDFEISEVG